MKLDGKDAIVNGGTMGNGLGIVKYRQKGFTKIINALKHFTLGQKMRAHLVVSSSGVEVMYSTIFLNPLKIRNHLILNVD